MAPPTLTPLELATSIILGVDRDMPPLEAETGSPRAALEDDLRAALVRPPCVVSFSGGRDSSAVLAVAMLVARREGLPDPIPMTLRFPNVESADESSWQEQVVRHVGARHWERLELQEDLDILGPLARGLLLRHGLLWPVNTHFHQPIFASALGGTVVTGAGGDEVLSPSVWVRANRVLAGQVRPTPKDAARVALAYGPRRLRARWFVGDSAGLAMPWLRPAAQQQLERSYASSIAREPIGYGAWLLRAWWPSRTRQTVERSLAALAGDAGVQVVHPLEGNVFLARLAATHGRAGFASRTQAMQHLFGDVLPAGVLSRSSKASFDSAFLGADCRAFVEAWDGTGAPTSIVDPLALKAMWRGEHGRVDGRSALLVQALWLDQQSQPG